jgi:hypothetical protein
MGVAVGRYGVGVGGDAVVLLLTSSAFCCVPQVSTALKLAFDAALRLRHVDPSVYQLAWTVFALMKRELPAPVSLACVHQCAV